MSGGPARSSRSRAGQGGRWAVRLLAPIGAASLLGGLAAGVFFLGGFFDVAADRADPAPVNWALAAVRRASIPRQAGAEVPADLDDPATVRAGALAYSRLGCTGCHGGPGVRPAAFSAGLNPRPNLKSALGELRPQDLFWVLDHGIKMSGMPSFDAHGEPGRARELWAVTAFLKRNPAVSAQEYQAWTAPPPAAP